MLRLHTRDQSELRKSRNVGIVEELRVLDAPTRSRASKGLQRKRVRRIADGMHGAVEPRVPGAGHELRQLIDGDKQNTALFRRARL